MPLTEVARYGKALDDLLALIGHQSEIRFFVDGTRNFGHQASTVHLMKRLVEVTKFAGRILLVYQEATRTEHGNTSEKLAYHFTGLDPTQINTVRLAYGSCADIRFVSYARRRELDGRAEFGFTGGSDDLSVNFATELKVRFFLRLQPFLWDDDASRKDDPYYESSRLEQPNGYFFYLAEEMSGFRNLICRGAAARGQSVPPATWTWYGHEQTFDPGLRCRTRNAGAIHRSLNELPNLRLWCWYGLHHFRDQVAEMALNLVLAAFMAQEAIRQPIVTASMSAGADLPGVLDLLHALANDMAERRDELPTLRAAVRHLIEAQPAAAAGFVPEKLDRLIFNLGQGVGRWINAGARLTILNSYDPALREWRDISSQIESALRGCADFHIVLVLLGPIPADIYDYFFTHSGIPSVFEGQTTSSLMLARGRSFLQIPREGHVIDSGYLTELGMDSFASEADEALQAARRLSSQRLAPYLKSGGDGSSRDYLDGLEKASSFIREVENPSAPVRQYFQALGRFSAQDSNDKLLVALSTLGKQRDAPKEPSPTLSPL